MMKAVKRIRSFGYNELTFDAFDTALEKTKRLQGNPQAVKRLEQIRQHFKDSHTKKLEGGTLGAELMERFRLYLKGEDKLQPQHSPLPMTRCIQRSNGFPERVRV